MADQRELARQLAALHANYFAALPGKLADLQRSCECLLHSRGDRDALDSAHRQAHSLAGSGATFGCERVSHAARSLEALLQTLPIDDVAHSEIARAAIAAALRALADAIREAIATAS